MLSIKIWALPIAILTATTFASSNTFLQNAGNRIEKLPSSRIVKVYIRYMRAADLSEMFGGNVIPLTSEHPGDAGKPNIQRPGAITGYVANLLPEGIQSMTAQEADNTIIIRYDTDDALRELTEVIAMLDKKPRSIAVTARTLLTFADKHGSKQQIQVEAQGTTTDQRILHLKCASDGSLAKVGGAELISVSSAANMLAWPNGDGTITVSVDWYLDTSWRVPGNAKPLKQHNVYRTDSFVRNGGRATITHARTSLPFGTADIVLDLTPTSLDNQTAPAPVRNGTGR